MAVVVGLTGKNASGKTEVAKYLEKKPCPFYSLSDAIRFELDQRGEEKSRENMIRVGNELREKEGAGTLGKRIRDKIEAGTEASAIVDSIRNPTEVEELRKLPTFVLLAIDAPVETRFERAMKRGREENANTLEEFKAIEDVENSDNPKGQQLTKTIELADYHIENIGTLEDLNDKVEEILAKYTF